MAVLALDYRSRHAVLLGWFVTASVLTHVLLLTLLPGWNVFTTTPPIPLTVELREPPPPPPPEVVPPKLLPVQAQPVPKPQPQRKQAPPPREEPPPPRAPILTAAPEAPPSPAAPVVPEQKPAPPPEPAKPPPVAVAPPPPAPVTPPRSDAAHLSNPPPNYPLAAKRRGDQGTVLVRLIVTADGHAKNVSVEKSSGYPALDEAAVAAVRGWRFVPARQGPQAIELPYTQSVVFRLD